MTDVRHACFSVPSEHASHCFWSAPQSSVAVVAGAEESELLQALIESTPKKMKRPLATRIEFAPLNGRTVTTVPPLAPNDAHLPALPQTSMFSVHSKRSSHGGHTP